MTDQHAMAGPDQRTREDPPGAALVREEAAQKAREGLDVDDVEYATPAHRQAWEEFYDHPATRAAQAAFDDRREQLELVRQTILMLEAQVSRLRADYTEKITAAQLVFQGQAHVPMFQLTKRIAELDKETFGVDVLQ